MIDIGLNQINISNIGLRVIYILSSFSALIINLLFMYTSEIRLFIAVYTTFEIYIMCFRMQNIIIIILYIITVMMRRHPQITQGAKRLGGGASDT